MECLLYLRNDPFGLGSCRHIYSYWFSGETFTDWELRATGGWEYNGYRLATLVRIEALVCLWTAVAGVILNLKGFAWMYDRASNGFVNGLMYALLGISIAIELVALS